MEPTTINDLPQDLLPEILSNLDDLALVEAQNVCRAWRRPSHILILKSVKLKSSDEIGGFIEHFDRDDTEISDFTAVQEIHIKGDDGVDLLYYFNARSIGRLFCRFPNLTNVLINTYSACLQGFTEELCQNILENCPKLEIFDVLIDEEDEDIYCRTMYKVRSLATMLYLDKVGSASSFGGITEFIKSFPRLRRTCGLFYQLENFQDYLPILQELSNLTAISVKQGYFGDDQENFAEAYLATMSKEHQDLLIKRISNVDELTYTSSRVFCPNSIKFIKKSFSGLKKLTIISKYKCPYWTDTHRQVLLDDVINLVVKDHASITLVDMVLPVLAESLPAIVQKLFSQPQFNRVLQVTVDPARYYQDKVDLHMQWPTTKRLDIAIGGEADPHNIVASIFSSQMENIDHVVFYIRGKVDYLGNIDTHTYNVVFKAISSLKEATLDIPNTFIDCETTDEVYQHISMETLTLRSLQQVDFPLLLYSYAVMFPNLKFLNLYYYEGERLQTPIDPYNINLRNYTLERFVLDMTQVKRTIKKYPIPSDFFVIQIEKPQEKPQSRNPQYRVALDLSSVITVNDEDYQDCVRVHIIIKSLQSLEVCMYNVDDYYEGYEEYDANYNDPRFDRLIIF